MSNEIKLSIVVAVYSETQSLIDTVDRLFNKDRGYIHEILLLVSPRSSDECIAISKELAQNNSLISMHMQKNNPGLGWAFREGLEAAKGTYVAIMSADLETEPEAVDRMVKKIEETGCDVVVGNRWLQGCGFKNYDPIKLVLNWIFQQVFRLLFLTRVGDLTYGFKILRKKVFDSIVWEGTLHEFCLESTLKPLKAKYTVEEVPTVWIGREDGESKNTFLRNFRYVALAFNVLLKTDFIKEK